MNFQMGKPFREMPKNTRFFPKNAKLEYQKRMLLRKQAILRRMEINDAAFRIQESWESYLSRKTLKEYSKMPIEAYYINLEKSNDRKETMEKQDFVIPLKRFDARFNELGEIGCAASHLQILEDSMGDMGEYVMVLEDDFCIRSTMKYKRFLLNLYDFLKTKSPDCVVMSGSRKIIDKTKSYKRFLRLYHSNTTTGYIVKKSYISELADVFRTAVVLLNFTKKIQNQRQKFYLTFFPIDQLWVALQEKDEWYTYNDSTIMCQKDGISTIGKGQDTDFKDLFTTTVDMTYKAYKYYNLQKWCNTWQKAKPHIWLENYYNNPSVLRGNVNKSGKIKI